MESNTTFGGNKMEKTVSMTVHWDKSMLFNGKFAEFHGSIQAEQENARLACEALQVFFDRPISLKQGTRTDEKPAKVENLVCDQSVSTCVTVRHQDETRPVLARAPRQRLATSDKRQATSDKRPAYRDRLGRAGYGCSRAALSSWPSAGAGSGVCVAPFVRLTMVRIVPRAVCAASAMSVCASPSRAAR